MSLLIEVMKTVGDIRRENLGLLIEEFKTAEKLAELVGSDPVYISQLRNKTPDVKTGRPREMGTLLARRMEVACEKQKGWMDQEHHADDPERGHDKARRYLVFEEMLNESQLSRDVLRTQITARTDISPEKKAEWLAALDSIKDVGTGKPGSSH